MFTRVTWTDAAFLLATKLVVIVFTSLKRVFSPTREVLNSCKIVFTTCEPEKQTALPSAKGRYTLYRVHGP